jgi:hypothetical protein
MTRYDKLMDAIKDELYLQYTIGKAGDGWDEADALESAHALLQMVEEYQSSPMVKRWRASD